MSRLSFRKEWRNKYPWVMCTEGMFCSISRKSPPGSRDGWMSRGITDWRHGTEFLKLHAESQYHRNAAVTASIAQQAESGGSVLETHCSAAARQLEERKQRNREIVQKLMRSVYFMVKNRIPHTTVYSNLIELQYENGDKILQQHIKPNAQ